MKLVILDRDGTINEDRDDFVKSADEWVPLPGALEAIARLNHAGWHTVVATNQSGLARGLFDMAALNAIHARMNRELAAGRRPHRRGLLLPARPRRRLRCRKPLPGLFATDRRALRHRPRRGAAGRRLAARPAGRRRRRLPRRTSCSPARRRGSTPPSSPRCSAPGAAARRCTPTSPPSSTQLLARASAIGAATPPSRDSVFGGCSDAVRPGRASARRSTSLFLVVTVVPWATVAVLLFDLRPRRAPVLGLRRLAAAGDLGRARDLRRARPGAGPREPARQRRWCCCPSTSRPGRPSPSRR